MTARLNLILVLGLAVCLLLGAVQAVVASGSPVIGWWVLGGGGGMSSGSQIMLNATLGQPVVGVSSTGNIELKSGYWAAPPAVGRNLYLPLVRR